MPVSIPTVQQLATLLTDVAVSYKNASFVAERIMPVVSVPRERFAYYVFGRSHLRRVETRRAVSAGYQRIDYAMSIATGACEEYGVEHPIDARIREESQAPLEPEVIATNLVTEALLLDQEKRVANLLTTPSNFANDLTSTPSKKWSDKTCSLHADITMAMEAVRRYIGLYPNTLLIPASVAQAISLANDITDYVKNVIGLVALEKADPQEGFLLPRKLWGLNVIIAGAIENTANLRQPEVIADIWGDNCILAYVPPKPANFVPAMGYIFRRTGKSPRVETYNDPQINSIVVRARMIQTELFVAKNASGKAIGGYLFTDVL